jgi:diguanylate cyclase (GGDEF)-like protein
MAFGLIPLEKRLKDNIRNYSLDQIFVIEQLSEFFENINKATGVGLLLTDRHGEKAVSAGNFVGFKPDTANAPGKKIRVAGRTVAHLYIEEGAMDAAKEALIDSIVSRLTREAEKTYESIELSLYADDLEKKLEKEQYQVKHGEKEDALTGVLNSTYFDNKMKVVDRSQVVPVAVICANINDWKYVNDHFGDEESDRLIQVVASFLKEEAKPEYIIGRCGGDFFHILIPMTADDEAEEYCSRVQQKCLAFEDEHLAPSVACGYVIKYNVEQTLSDLLSDAEYEMFNQKFEIKNAPGYRERLEKA